MLHKKKLAERVFVGEVQSDSSECDTSEPLVEIGCTALP